jgi:ATP-dependent DNA helicase RecG
VNDDGSLAGVEVTDKLLQNLAALRSDGNIQPLPAISVSKHTLDGGDVAVVEVLPADLPPVRYKGRVHVRVGPRKAVATEQEERVLSEKRVSAAKTFDALPCLDSDLDSLSLELFRLTYLPNAVAPEILAENHRELTAQLASLRLWDLKRACPTNAGILLLSKNPLMWLPGAYIQFVQFDGTSLADEVMQEKQFSGDLLTVVREAETLADLLIQSRPVRETTMRERMVSTYPRVALHELLVNAVLHRTYESTSPIRFYWFSDRIEMQSPGGLYGAVTRENFPDQNSYRNPVIAEALKILGFANRFGTGVTRAQTALQRNGNPPAEFTFDPHYVLATVRLQ